MADDQAGIEELAAATAAAVPRPESTSPVIPCVWVRLVWAIGAVAVLAVSFALADPGLLVLAIDPELLALIVLSSIALMRASGPGLFLSGCAAALARGASTVAANLTGRHEPRCRTGTAPGPDV